MPGGQVGAPTSPIPYRCSADLVALGCSDGAVQVASCSSGLLLTAFEGSGVPVGHIAVGAGGS